MKPPVLYDDKAPKKAVNLSINSDLLHKARLLKINLSNTLEETLVALLMEAQRENWANKNKSAIEEYNRRVEREFR
jgi:antitoxin CcdA